MIKLASNPIAMVAAVGVVLTGLAGTGTWIYMSGQKAYSVKVERESLKRQRYVRSINHNMDRETLQEDSRLKSQLQENDAKWSKQTTDSPVPPQL